MNSKKGFTLIELLVVVAIIGVLATIVTVSLSTSTVRGRSAAFKSEISSLQKAFVATCFSSNITGADVQNGKTFNKNNIVFTPPATSPQILLTQSCGLSGSGTFSVTIESTNGAGCTKAAVNESKITFFPVGC